MLDRVAAQRPNGSRDSCPWDLATTMSTGEPVNEREGVHSHSLLTAAHTSHIPQFALNALHLPAPLQLTCIITLCQAATQTSKAFQQQRKRQHPHRHGRAQVARPSAPRPVPPAGASIPASPTAFIWTKLKFERHVTVFRSTALSHLFTAHGSKFTTQTAMPKTSKAVSLPSISCTLKSCFMTLERILSTIASCDPMTTRAGRKRCALPPQIQRGRASKVAGRSRL